MTTTLWDQVPAGVPRTDSDGSPRRFYDQVTAEFVTLGELREIPYGLQVEIADAAEQRRRERLEALHRFVWWCDLPRASQLAIIRRARRRRRRRVVAAVRARGRR